MTNTQQSIVLLYRKNSSNITQYINDMRNILLQYDFDMILGDFNINYYNEDEMKPLRRLMTSFNMIKLCRVLHLYPPAVYLIMSMSKQITAISLSAWYYLSITLITKQLKFP